MEIHDLKVLFTEDEINRALARGLPRNVPLREVNVRLTEEGIHVKGVYALLLGVPFETRWELSVRQGKLAARLAGVKVIGMGAGILTNALMSALGAAAAHEDAIGVEGDTVLLDPDQLLAKQGFPSRTNLTAVRCGEGRVWVEASNNV
jgi:hypothetical protein